MEKNNLLFEALFNKDISAGDTADFLADLTNEHPYFSPAQFFLLKQTPEESGNYYRQLSKTSLLFNNNYWLNFLLYEINQPDNNSNEFPVQQNASVNESALAKNEIHIPPTDTALPEIISEPDEQKNIEVATDIIESATSIEKNEDEVHSEVTIGEAEPIVVNEENIAEESVLPPVAEIPVEITAPENEVSDTGSSTEPESSVSDENYTTVEDDREVDEIPEENFNDDTNSSAQRLKIDLALSDTTEDTITFEPLHTTDYFASVGIKLSEEIKPVDKLGQQLKSFTEWLKTMKKIHVEESTAPSQLSDSEIQNLAEKSNVNGDVVTEAMAEVLMQQNRIDKAIAMLEKLSLLNPAKSAYFAAKINKLKE